MAAASLLSRGELSNPTPTLYIPSQKVRDETHEQDAIVSEIFDLIRDIKDPEHPHTLEELNVVSEDCITVNHHNHSTIHNATRHSTSDSRDSCSKEPNDCSSTDTNSCTQEVSSNVLCNQPSDHNTTEIPDPASGTNPPLSYKEEEEGEEDREMWIKIVFTPTVPHCSLATLIGLCLRVKLERRLEYRFKLDIIVSEGAHTIEGDVNKQINDKERVAAAMENPNLREMVEECIKEVEY